MSVQTNIVKGWITSIVGTITMVITLVLIWTKDIDFVWQGVAGLITGSILLLAPGAIEGFIRQFLKSQIVKETENFNENHCETTNSDEKIVD